MKKLNLEEAIKILKENGIRVTVQRRIILETLLKFPSDFCTVNDIAKVIRNKYPYIAVSSIYKNLELFSKLGIIGCICSPDLEKIYYDTKGIAKAYFICKECKKIFRKEDIEIKYNKDRDKIEKFYLICTGHCGKCKKNKGVKK